MATLGSKTIVPCIERILIKSLTFTGRITSPPFTPFILSIFKVRFVGIGVDVILITPEFVFKAKVFKEVFTNSSATGLLPKPTVVCCPALPTSVNLTAKIVEESANVWPAKVASDHENINFPLFTCVVPKSDEVIPGSPICSTPSKLAIFWLKVIVPCAETI